LSWRRNRDRDGRGHNLHKVKALSVPEIHERAGGFTLVKLVLMACLPLLALAAQTPSAPPRGSGDAPEAFVPFLTPIEKVGPLWPEAARADGVQGTVEMLVSIDARGFVTKVEAWTGPVILREAAIEAVRQWKFQPVLRSGRAVAAYTTALLVRMDPARIGSFSLNMSEERGAAERTVELERRFPRSKQQVLADLEQDAKGTDRRAQFFLLKRLSQAAWEAGETGKAARYATEWLSHAEESGSAENRGDIIHGANVILGLVALEAGHPLDARKHLLEAGKVPGSPSLNSSGPNMLLAKKLLEIGDRDAVLEYLSLCRRFWLDGKDKLDEWSATVRGGGVPSFGANLNLR
jgi:TonB family protein